ncbi:hypothetical protein O3P69_016639 [Scylla paramamosain]|uniref:Uncharacterized protein n=1 Tax=Scylla paramamosain TaxID=85552 RepID=A0AAW0SZH4_SCYPA
MPRCLSGFVLVLWYPEPHSNPVQRQRFDDSGSVIVSSTYGAAFESRSKEAVIWQQLSCFVLVLESLFSVKEEKQSLWGKSVRVSESEQWSVTLATTLQFLTPALMTDTR